jgi:predicted small metal-binding protein
MPIWAQGSAKWQKYCDAKISAWTATLSHVAKLKKKILKQAAEHAGTTHDMKEIPEEVLAKVRAAIRNE